MVRERANDRLSAHGRVGVWGLAPSGGQGAAPPWLHARHSCSRFEQVRSNRDNASVCCHVRIAGCWDVAEQPGAGRHNPATNRTIQAVGRCVYLKVVQVDAEPVDMVESVIRPGLCSSRWLWAGVLSVVATLGGCAGTGGVTASKPPLSSLVVSSIDGFVRTPKADPINQQVPGSLGIAEAASSSCDGVSQTTLRQDHWQASYLRVWVHRTKIPSASAYIGVCISRMKHVPDAAENYRQVRGSLRPPKGASGVTTISIPGVPGVIAFAISKTPEMDLLAFSKNAYVVTLFAYAGSSLSSRRVVFSQVPLPIANVASEQYDRLPG